MSKKYLIVVLLTNLIFGLGTIVVYVLFRKDIITAPVVYISSVMFVLYFTFVPLLVLLFNLISPIFALLFLRPFDYYTKRGFWISIIFFIVLLMFWVLTIEIGPA